MAKHAGVPISKFLSGVPNAIYITLVNELWVVHIEYHNDLWTQYVVLFIIPVFRDITCGLDNLRGLMLHFMKHTSFDDRIIALFLIGTIRLLKRKVCWKVLRVLQIESFLLVLLCIRLLRPGDLLIK